MKRRNWSDCPAEKLTPISLGYRDGMLERLSVTYNHNCSTWNNCEIRHTTLPHFANYFEEV
jgi:hypothetical protein